MENAKSQELVKSIDGTAGKYVISSCGKVMRFKANKWSDVNGEINHGYNRVNLSLNGKAKKFRVHRLVAQAFIDNPLNKPFVNHIDGNKLNNHVSNLEWCTASENEHHSYSVLGKVAWTTKPDHVRQQAFEMRKSGVKTRVICEVLKVSRSWMDKQIASYAI